MHTPEKEVPYLGDNFYGGIGAVYTHCRYRSTGDIAPWFS